MTYFEPNTLYYIRFGMGEEMLTEVYTTEDKNQNKVTSIHKPLYIKLHPNQDTNMMNIVAVPLVDPSITDEQTFVLNSETVQFQTDNISDNMREIYYQYWDKFDSIVDGHEDEPETQVSDDIEEPDTDLEHILNNLNKKTTLH